MEFMNNPAMMQQMESMMKNPEIQKMMSDPNILNNLGGMMNGNKPNFNPDLNNNQNSNNDDTIEIQDENLLNSGDVVLLQNLKNENYNNKKGIIDNYNNENQRYIVKLVGLDKSIAVKKENVILNIE